MRVWRARGDRGDARSIHELRGQEEHGFVSFVRRESTLRDLRVASTVNIATTERTITKTRRPRRYEERKQ